MQSPTISRVACSDGGGGGGGVTGGGLPSPSDTKLSPPPWGELPWSEPEPASKGLFSSIFTKGLGAELGVCVPFSVDVNASYDKT